MTPPTTLPADLQVEDGRDRYLAQNHFTVESYTAPTFAIPLFGRELRLYNTQARKRAIPLHDLHHVLTGYGTDFIGEAEIGIWELRAGCRSLIVYYLDATAVLFGLFLSPRRVWKAFRRARGARTLYRLPRDYDAWLGMTVGELRAHLGVPLDGAADRPAELHAGTRRAQAQQLSAK